MASLKEYSIVGAKKMQDYNKENNYNSNYASVDSRHKKSVLKETVHWKSRDNNDDLLEEIDKMKEQLEQKDQEIDELNRLLFERREDDRLERLEDADMSMQTIDPRMTDADKLARNVRKLNSELSD